jgi:hypothetical protein
MTHLLWTYLLTRLDHLRARLATQRHDEVGAVTVEAVLLISLMVVLALTVVGIIAAKVIAKANSIDLGGNP